MASCSTAAASITITITTITPPPPNATTQRQRHRTTLNTPRHGAQHGDGPDDTEEVGSVLVDLGADLLGDLVAGQLPHRLNLLRGDLGRLRVRLGQG